MTRVNKWGAVHVSNFYWCFFWLYNIISTSVMNLSRTFSIKSKPFELKRHDNKIQFVSGTETTLCGLRTLLGALTTFINKMKMVNFAMWSLIVVTTAITVVVIIGIRNSIASARTNEAIKKEGTEASALIVDASQHQNQNAEGRLSLNLTIEFTAGTEKVVTRKDVVIKIFDADEFKPGQRVTIRYKNDDPSQIVVLGNAGN